MMVDEISSLLTTGFIQPARMEEHIIDMGKKRWVESGGEENGTCLPNALQL